MTQNPRINISRSLFFRLKPFYINRPTERGTESCMCIYCCNMHQLYKVLHKENPGVFQTDSISEFLASSIKCDSDSNRMFPKLECINGNCKNRCAINLPSNTLLFPSQPEKLLSYYVYERINEEYFNAAGKKVSIKRTARVDKKETLLPSMIIFSLRESLLDSSPSCHIRYISRMNTPFRF